MTGGLAGSPGSSLEFLQLSVGRYPHLHVSGLPSLDQLPLQKLES